MAALSVSCSLNVVLSLSLAAVIARAATPSLDHLYPVAVARGTTNTVTAIGKFEPWPAKMWVDVPGVVFKPETNNGKFVVEVAANAPAGAHLVRAFNEQGASVPRFLVITETAPVTEEEPNDERQKPQRIEQSPAQINGRLDKTGDVDGYEIALKAGQTVVASLECFVLMSPVDAVLRLVDSRGVEVAFNHDDGRTFDPELAFTAPRDGAYILQVFGFAYPADSSIRFTGNSKCVYRLHVAVDQKRDCPLASMRRETEPNDSAQEATPLEVPDTVAGCIGATEDLDHFTFAAKKGEKLKLEVQSAALGFPLDSWLKVLDSSGKELVRKDDEDSADPTLEWSAPDDGKYIAAIGNLLQRGGSNYLYRFGIERPMPAIRPTVSEHAFTVEAGKTNEIKVALRRVHDHTGKIKARLAGLPDTIRCHPEETNDKAGEVVLRVAPQPEANGFSGPIRIVLTEENGKQQPALFRMVSRGENNGVPQGYSKLLIDATEHLWLTVTAPK